MKLTYNYTTKDFIYYPSDLDEKDLFFTPQHDPDTDQPLGTFIRKGDCYATYEVDWTTEYLTSFMKWDDDIQEEILRSEKEIV